jgi:hypothetical protein
MGQNSFTEALPTKQNQEKPIAQSSLPKKQKSTLTKDYPINKNPTKLKPANTNCISK